jgi:hypothetical protein
VCVRHEFAPAAMLAADKLLLRSTVKQRAIQLREKELTLFNENFNAVGTQSAVLAGFAMTSFAEIDLPHNAFYAQKAFLHIFVVTSVCANLLCTACTTFVSVWGSGKALRGKDGSMDQAVDGMHDERTFIFSCFGVGLISTLLSLMSAAWILMTLEVAAVATLGISWAIFIIMRQAWRLSVKFGLSPEEVISFRDIMASPAVPSEGALASADDYDPKFESGGLLGASGNKARRGTYDV